MPRTNGIRRRRPQVGFTLVELLVVIAIMTTLLSIGGFMMNDYLRKSRLRGSAQDVEGDFEVIRNSARTRQSAVVAFVTANNITASTYRDKNSNGIYDTGDDLTEQVLDHPYRSVNLSVTGGPYALAPVTTIQYNAVGALPDDQRYINIQIPTDTKRQYQITVFTTGRTRVERSEDSGASWTTRGY